MEWGKVASGTNKVFTLLPTLIQNKEPLIYGPWPGFSFEFGCWGGIHPDASAQRQTKPQPGAGAGAGAGAS